MGFLGVQWQPALREGIEPTRLAPSTSKAKQPSFDRSHAVKCKSRLACPFMHRASGLASPVGFSKFQEPCAQTQGAGAGQLSLRDVLSNRRPESGVLLQVASLGSPRASAPEPLLQAPKSTLEPKSSKVNSGCKASRLFLQKASFKASKAEASEGATPAFQNFRLRSGKQSLTVFSHLRTSPCQVQVELRSRRREGSCTVCSTTN